MVNWLYSDCGEDEGLRGLIFDNQTYELHPLSKDCHYDQIKKDVLQYD